MPPDTGKLVINGSTRRLERRPAAFDLASTPVDGRSVSELLDFAGQFAALVRFYDLKDEPDGTWSEFFRSHPTMVLAAIDADSPARNEARFARYARAIDAASTAEDKLPQFERALHFVFRMAVRMNAWLRAVDGTVLEGLAAQTRDKLMEAIEATFRDGVRRLLSYADGAAATGALGRRITLDVSSFSPLWRLDRPPADPSIYKGPSVARRIDAAVPHLEALSRTFVDAIGDLGPFARTRLATAINEPGHPPHLALYIAFAELFGTAQATLDTLPARLIPYYYHTVLNDRPRAAVPDRVWLSLTLAEGTPAPGTTVPKGATFAGGAEPDGKPILYAADTDLLVSPTRLMQMRTLRVVRGPLLLEPPPPPPPPQTAPQATAQTPAQAQPAQAKPAPTQQAAEPVRQVIVADILAERREPFATFGEAAAGVTGAARAVTARLGFSVQARCLFLAGGNRRLIMDVGFDEAAWKAQVAGPLEKVASRCGLDRGRILKQILSEAFSLALTTAAGWVPVGYSVDMGDDDANFSISVALPPSAPAIAPITEPPPDPPPPVPPPIQPPTLRVELKQQPVRLSGRTETVSLYPLSLLAGLPLKMLRLAVTVAGLPGFTLRNTDGAIDMSAPFLPFGGQPVVGSYMELNHPELFAKPLESLRLALAWHGLPTVPDGFKGWYKDYTLGPDGQKAAKPLFDNTSFRSKVEIRQPGRWVLSPKSKTEISLFGDKPGGAPPPETVVDGLDLDDAAPPAGYDARTGALRLSLAAPSYTFGADLYSRNVMASVSNSMPDASKLRKDCETAWLELSDAARMIASTVVSIRQVPNGTAQGSNTKAFGADVRRLLDDLRGRLLQMVLKLTLDTFERMKDQVSLDQMKNLTGSLPQPRNIDKVEHARRLKTWLADAKAMVPAPFNNGFDKAGLLIDAVVAIDEIDAATGPEGPKGRADVLQIVEPRLASSRGTLEKEYGERLNTCISSGVREVKPISPPNPPWVPQLKSVAVDYSASADVVVDGTVIGFRHLLPWDGERAFELRPRQTPTLIPRFSHDGNLYLGLKDLRPPQSLSILMHMAAGGDDLPAGTEPPKVRWEYLEGDRWRPLAPLSTEADTTKSLRNSGIVKVDLPSYDPGSGGVLGAGLQWLRVAVPTGAGGFPGMLGVYLNALTATWQDPGGGGAHLRRPLPRLTIKAPAEALPNVEAAVQPIESFGGQPAEDDLAMGIRLSERLRHKDRAVLGWDYERLVLDRFPTIRQVAVLPARNASKGGAPGEVLVVVVPGPDGLDAADTTAPTASPDLLSQIRAALIAQTNPFIQIDVVNPVYVRIEVKAQVLFRTGNDPGASAKRLNEDLITHLSPWNQGGVHAVSEEGIANFIQTRPYVAALQRLSCAYSPDTTGLDWYYLTTAKQHRIEAAGGPGAAPADDPTGY